MKLILRVLFCFWQGWVAWGGGRHQETTCGRPFSKMAPTMNYIGTSPKEAWSVMTVCHPWEQVTLYGNNEGILQILLRSQVSWFVFIKVELSLWISNQVKALEKAWGFPEERGSLEAGQSEWACWRRQCGKEPQTTFRTWEWPLPGVSKAPGPSAMGNMGNELCQWLE